MNPSDTNECTLNDRAAPTLWLQQTPADEYSRIVSFVGAMTMKSMDPRVRLAFEFCQDQIPEPFLSLSQLQKALAIIRPGKRPCSRTIQRWVQKKGFPCYFDEISERRVYRLSDCLVWLNKHCPAVSIAQSAIEAARRMFLNQRSPVDSHRHIPR